MPVHVFPTKMSGSDQDKIVTYVQPYEAVEMGTIKAWMQFLRPSQKTFVHEMHDGMHGKMSGEMQVRSAYKIWRDLARNYQELENQGLSRSWKGT